LPVTNSLLHPPWEKPPPLGGFLYLLSVSVKTKKEATSLAPQAGWERVVSFSSLLL
jgi:hypothetical protein